MRREERHHLKANPVAAALTQAQDFLSEHGRTLAIIGVVIVGGLAALGGYLYWQQQQQNQAGAMLADAWDLLSADVIPPPAPTDGEPDGAPAWEQPPDSFPSDDARLEAALPRLREVATSYPDTPQGITARFQAASILVDLGRLDEAVTEYEQVIERDADGVYGRMARLGLAETHLLAGAYDDAIRLLEDQTGSVDSYLPVDAVLMRLGQAYQLAGQHDEALAAFTRIVEEFPLSVYFAEAQQTAEILRRQTTSAAASND